MYLNEEKRFSRYLQILQYKQEIEDYKSYIKNSLCKNTIFQDSTAFFIYILTNKKIKNISYNLTLKNKRLFHTIITQGYDID